MDQLLQADLKRKSKLPPYQYHMRKLQAATNGFARLWHRLWFNHYCKIYHIDLSPYTKIGPGWYIGHPSGITINEDARIGSNFHIHKGALIGAAYRGDSKGAPVIGDRVWVGINACVVGAVTIGDDVMIAPNAFVNCDVPSHSVVVGNPCTIHHKDNATAVYIP